ncbi:MAG TPA: SDR family oxidoreductase [Caulobacterales bacterium]|nr:SDR family oxidoreductase [Caulobacterales bacterium]
MKSVLITGANRGIGLEHARRYASRGVSVFAAVRAPEEAEELQGFARGQDGRVTILKYDAAAPDAADRLKRDVGGAAIDLLFANAGVGGRYRGLDQVDADEIVATFRVNALAPLLLAQALADNVVASARKLMAFQSSLMGSIEDNGSGGAYAYRISKVSLNMIARTISRDLARDGVIAVALHPGWVRTRMGGAGAKLSVEASVEGQQNLLDKLTPAQSGGFFNYDGRELPW